MVLEAPDIVKVLPVFVQLEVRITSPDALIADVPEQVNVPPVREKPLVLSAPDSVCVPSVWL